MNQNLDAWLVAAVHAAARDDGRGAAHGAPAEDRPFAPWLALVALAQRIGRTLARLLTQAVGDGL